MATILTFTPRSSTRRPATLPRLEASIVFFPGVRREPIDVSPREMPDRPDSTPKGGKRVAGRRRKHS